MHIVGQELPAQYLPFTCLEMTMSVSEWCLCGRTAWTRCRASLWAQTFAPDTAGVQVTLFNALKEGCGPSQEEGTAQSSLGPTLMLQGLQLRVARAHITGKQTSRDRLPGC